MNQNKFNAEKEIKIVNDNLKINVNKENMLDILTKSWKKSTQYNELMAQYYFLEKDEKDNWNFKYENEYQKFAEELLGDSISFINKQEIKQVDKKVIGIETKGHKLKLSSNQILLLQKRNMNSLKELFPQRDIRGYQEKNEFSELPKKMGKNEKFVSNIPHFFNNNNNFEIILDDQNNHTVKPHADNSFNNSILKLNPLHQRQLAQGNINYSKEKDINETISNEDTNNYHMDTFNNRIKKNSMQRGLSAKQLNILASRFDENLMANRFQNNEYENENKMKPSSFEEVKENLHLSLNQLKLLARHNADSSQQSNNLWSNVLDGPKGHDNRNVSEQAEESNSYHNINISDQLNSNKNTQNINFKSKNISDKIVTNFLAEKPNKQSILKTEVYLDQGITSQINPFGDLKNKVKKVVKISKNNSMTATKKNNSNLIISEIRIKNEKDPTNLLEPFIEENYVSIVDPKKRPNLKKLKYGEDHFTDKINDGFIGLTPDQVRMMLNMQPQLSKKETFNQDNEVTFSYGRKELKDYGIKYLDPTKTPNLNKTISEGYYTYEGYHPREIREIERRQLHKLIEEQQKETIIEKNIRKSKRLAKRLDYIKKKEKAKPLPQILIQKYLSEGKKVVNGYLIDTEKTKK